MRQQKEHISHLKVKVLPSPKLYPNSPSASSFRRCCRSFGNVVDEGVENDDDKPLSDVVLELALLASSQASASSGLSQVSGHP